MNNEINDEYYRFIFENSYDAILLTTPDGGVHRANNAACLLFQMTEEEICQRGRSGLLDLNDERIPQIMKERAIHGKVKAEVNFVRKDGTVFPTESTSAIFTDSEAKEWTAIIIRDISLFKEAENAMRKAKDDANWYATTDFLTGILNRRILMEKIDVEMTRAKRENSTLSILMLDIDSFKSINDNFGHNAGDLVLQRFADLLYKKLRPYDFVGRYGGDEFLVCLSNTAYPVSISIAERIRSLVVELSIMYGEQQIPITTSIGVSTFYGDDPIDINDFISDVDRNMYIAKEHKNCVYGVKGLESV
jgi:diguanylate cyclase (GGDEF)-like protein/PAS domain S-box-containing protein